MPLFASKEFAGKSPRGLYGDVVEELDWSVGQVLEALREEGSPRTRSSFFTSDNGPWLTIRRARRLAGLLARRQGQHLGRRHARAGHRLVAGQDQAGRDARAGLQHGPVHHGAGARGRRVPEDRPIDGVDLSPLLLGSKSLPERPFFYYRGDQLFACRLGEWKRHFFTQTGYGQAKPEQHDRPLLFHLGFDPSEERNVATEHPDVIARIRSIVNAHQSALVPGEPRLQ